MGKVAVESIRCQSVKFMSGSSGLGELPNTLGLGSDVMELRGGRASEPRAVSGSDPEL